MSDKEKIPQLTAQQRLSLTGDEVQVFCLRVPQKMYTRLKKAAKQDGKSLNLFVVECVNHVLGG